MQTISELWRALQPLVQQEIANGGGRSSGLVAGGLAQHALDGAYHDGILGDSQAPQFAKLDGSRAFTGNIVFSGSQTVDGVDVSAHATNASAHHAPVTAGTLIGLSGQQVSVANGSAQYQVPVTGASPFAPAFTALSGMAGDGLTFGSGAFAVGAGTLISVGANDISLANGSAQYQVPVTGASPFTPAFTALSGMAGDGLSFGSGAFAVGVANTGATGLTVEANAVRLTSSNNTGAAAAILATDATGTVTVPHVVGGTDVATPLLKTASGNLTITPAGTNVNITNGKTLQSNYVSGWAGSGYRIDSNVSLSGESFAEFDNLSVRGTMSVYELVINQIRGTNGTIIVSSVGKIASISGSDWTFEDPEASGVCAFAVNDIVIIQNVDVNASTIVKRLVRRVTVVSGATITVTAASGGPADAGTVAAGDVVVRIGNSTNAARQGVVLITSDMSNSPYIDIVSGVTSWADWTGGTKTKGRFGLLSGLSVGSANEYGLAVSYDGFGASNAYLKIGTAGAEQNNVSSTWRAGGTALITINPTYGISLQSYDATSDVIIYGDQRIIEWASSLPSTDPGGAIWTQYTATKNEMYLQARQTGSRAGLIQLAAYGEAASGNYADTVLLTMAGAESSATRSYLNIRADDVEIDLGNGSANIGNLTLYTQQLLVSDGSSSDDGSESAPLFSFLNDSNTGMYRSAADTLNFAVGGSNRLDITTTSINPRLPIYASAGEGIRIVGNASGATATAYLAFYDNAGNRQGWVGDGSTSNQDIYLLSDNGAVRLRDSSGVDALIVSGGIVTVNQTGASAAIPALEITQNDLSEEFFNLITTVGTGNAIDTAALGSYYGKFRVAVNGTFKYVPLYNS